MIVMQLKGCVKYNNNFRYIKFCVNGEVFWLKMTNDLGLTFLHFEFSIELVSKELNHFGVIADLFRQIGSHSRFVLFCSF